MKKATQVRNIIPGRMTLVLFGIILCSSTNVAAGNIEGFPSNDTFYRPMGWKAFLNSINANTVIDICHIDYELLNATIFHMTNKIRSEQKLHAFRYDTTLFKAANIHSRQMAKRNFIGHANPYSYDYRCLFDRLQACGYEFKSQNRFGENIAYLSPVVPYDLYKKVMVGNKLKCSNIRIEKKGNNYEYILTDDKGYDIEKLEALTYSQFAQAVIQVWLNSKEHKKNLLNKNYTSMGCAVMLNPRTHNKLTDLPSCFITQVFGE